MYMKKMQLSNFGIIKKHENIRCHQTSESVLPKEDDVPEGPPLNDSLAAHGGPRFATGLRGADDGGTWAVAARDDNGSGGGGGEASVVPSIVFSKGAPEASATAPPLASPPTCADGAAVPSLFSSEEDDARLAGSCTGAATES
jgi:hypothetical protein